MSDAGAEAALLNHAPRAPAQPLHSALPEVAALLRHPQFDEAARLFVRLTLEAYEQNAAARQILGNTARHMAFSLITTLSARAELEPETAPATQTRLIETIVGMGLSSHGKIEGLINRLVDQRMITRAPMAHDRRIKALQPSEALLALDDLLCAAHARPCALLEAHPVVAGVAARERSVTRRMRAAALPLIESGGAMLMRNPQILPFLSVDGGWLVLSALLDAVWRGDVRAQRFDAIAKRCGVSRPHVRALLLKVHEYGLLEQTAPGLLRATPQFMAAAQIWIAECLAAFINCCRLAQPAQAPAPPHA